MTHESNQEGAPLSELAKYPRWNEREVRILWHKVWFDGPIDGLIEFEGQPYWFSFWCDTDEPGNPFYYCVYPITEDELEVARAWRIIDRQFNERWVETNAPTDPEARNSKEVLELGSEWQGHMQSLPDFTKRPPAAWFSSGGNPDFHSIHLTPSP